METDCGAVPHSWWEYRICGVDTLRIATPASYGGLVDVFFVMIFILLSCQHLELRGLG